MNDRQGDLDDLASVVAHFNDVLADGVNATHLGRDRLAPIACEAIDAGADNEMCPHIDLGRSVRRMIDRFPHRKSASRTTSTNQGLETESQPIHSIPYFPAKFTKRASDLWVIERR